MTPNWEQSNWCMYLCGVYTGTQCASVWPWRPQHVQRWTPVPTRRDQLLSHCCAPCYTGPRRHWQISLNLLITLIRHQSTYHDCYVAVGWRGVSTRDAVTVERRSDITDKTIRRRVLVKACSYQQQCRCWWHETYSVQSVRHKSALVLAPWVCRRLVEIHARFPFTRKRLRLNGNRASRRAGGTVA